LAGALDSSGDRLLLIQLRQGNSSAFDAIYKKYWQSVYAAVYKRLQDSYQAKDITQEIFLQLWHKRNEYEIDNLQAYLYTSARNRVLTCMKKESRFVPVPELLAQLKASDNADYQVIAKEFLAAFEALICSLTSSQQKIFRMRYQDGLSTSEIAEILDISRKTVQNQLTRATTKVKSSLVVICMLFSILR
jgi:RNA polymerase sigma-70 factor (ECF subfamily)